MKHSLIESKHVVPVGLLLVILGGMVLLGNLGLFGGMSGITGAVILAAAGAYLARIYYRNQKRVWALPIGFALFGAAAAAISGSLAGSSFLAFAGLGFLLVFLDQRRHWWALIPAGVLFTLALVAGLAFVAPNYIAPVLFLGFAATFGSLYRLPDGKRWAIYPAIGAMVIAIATLSFSGGWFLPVLLIAGGAYLLSQQPRVAMVDTDASSQDPAVTKEVQPLPENDMTDEPHHPDE
jgi:hypothetical protein